MKNSRSGKFGRTAAVGILTTLAVTGIAAAQGFYVGEANGTIQVATAAGVTTYAAVTANDAIGGMILDSSNNLYVTDTTAGIVYQYASNGTRTTFASGLTSPGDIALDGSGNVYVANTAAGTILKYGAGGGTGVTYATGLLMPQAITFGPTGILYVAEEGNSASTTSTTGLISAIPAGGGAKTTLASGLAAPVTLTLNPAGNTLYVGFYQGTKVSGYATAGGTAVNTYSALTFGNFTSDVTMDAAGNLYVAQPGNSTITLVTPGLATSTYATVGNQPDGFVYGAAIPEPGTFATALGGAAGLLVASSLRRWRTV